MERRARACENVQSERAHAGVDEADDADSLTIDEEAILRSYHEERMLRFVSSIGLPEKVGATAVLYFKRFFVDRSVTEFNPSVIALSALYAAGKVEEVYLPADRLVVDFHSVVDSVKIDLLAEGSETATVGVSDQLDVANGTAMRVNADALLQTELDFLQLLQFHLVCYHGLRSVGVLREILRTARVWCDNEGADENKEKSAKESEVLGRVCARAHNIVARKVLLTELPLTDTPAVIALAAVATAAVDEGVETDDDNAVDAVLTAAAPKSKLPDNDSGGVVSAVRAAAWTIRETPNPATFNSSGNEISSTGNESMGMDRQRIEMLRQLEARRRRLQIRSNDPLSIEFKQARQAQDETRFLADRDREAPSHSNPGKRERVSAPSHSRESTGDLDIEREGDEVGDNGDHADIDMDNDNQIEANRDGNDGRAKRVRHGAW